uniref:Uncharacterized protein n=1 Tax=Caenorhabditis japonica TaxID=281687 RepID=A0A8R1IFM5_CAEJA
VPPLSEKQKPLTTFSLGLFIGMSIILLLAILLTWWASPGRPDEPKWVAVRLFRGPLLLFFSIFLCGVNMAGWAENFLAEATLLFGSSPSSIYRTACNRAAELKGP